MYTLHFCQTLILKISSLLADIDRAIKIILCKMALVTLTHCGYFPVHSCIVKAFEIKTILCLSADKQADIVDAFNTTSRCLDHILNINNVYFDKMVSQIYPTELQLNKANTSDTEAVF